MDTFKFRGSFNKELVERYEWNARFHGSEIVKKDAASAKRMSTQLSKTIAQFESIVKPEQKLALHAASSVMTALAAELDRAAAWARAYKSHSDRVAAVKKAKVEDVAALNRWAGNDAAMLAEFNDLMEFLEHGHRRPAAINEWLRNFKQLPTEVDVLAPSSSVNNLLALRATVSELMKLNEVSKVRRIAAEAWLDLSVKEGAHGRDGSYYVAGYADYEAWRTARTITQVAVEPTLAPNFKAAALGETP